MKRKKETAERPAHERLLEFGARLFIQEGPRLKPRVLVMRDGDIEKIDVAPIVGKLGMDAFIQAAAVVSRTVDVHDLVAILAPGKSHGKAVPVPVGRSGIADAPILAARSRAGACHVWLLAVTSRDRRTTEVKGHGLAPSAIGRYDDWCDPLFYVDPVLENHFAEAKLPGASRQIVPSAPATVSEQARAAGTVRSILPDVVGIIAKPRPPRGANHRLLSPTRGHTPSRAFASIAHPKPPSGRSVQNHTPEEVPASPFAVQTQAPAPG